MGGERDALGMLRVFLSDRARREDVREEEEVEERDEEMKR